MTLTDDARGCSWCNTRHDSVGCRTQLRVQQDLVYSVGRFHGAISLCSEPHGLPQGGDGCLVKKLGSERAVWSSEFSVEDLNLRLTVYRRCYFLSRMCF